MHHVDEKVFQNTLAINLALIVDNHDRRDDMHATTVIFTQEQKIKSN